MGCVACVEAEFDALLGLAIGLTPCMDPNPPNPRSAGFGLRSDSSEKILTKTLKFAIKLRHYFFWKLL